LHSGQPGVHDRRDITVKKGIRDTTDRTGWSEHGSNVRDRGDRRAGDMSAETGQHESLVGMRQSEHERQRWPRHVRPRWPGHERGHDGQNMFFEKGQQWHKQHTTRALLFKKLSASVRNF
jgi:hypothetical protein